MKNEDENMSKDSLYSKGALPALSDIDLQPRPRINDLMLDAVKKPVTAVTANFGFGKTHAVSTLLDIPDYAVIWLQLAQLDNLAPRLWERILIGIGKYDAVLSADLKSLGFPESLAAYHTIFRLFAEAIGRSPYAHTIIVFDDFHVIDNPDIINLITYVADEKFENLSIVLISSGNVHLSLAEYAEKGILSSITQEDLRMTKEEITEYYRLNEIEIDEPTVDRVIEWTDGWPFAICLLGLSLIKEGFSKDALLSRELLNIYDLIERNIVGPMSESVRRFFLKVSLLESASPALIRTLAGDDAFVLREIETRHISLLHYDTQSGSYRVMGLFREYLVDRYNDLSAAEIAALHIMAAEWYQKTGDTINALTHFYAAADYENAFAVIFTYTYRLPSETADYFIKLIDEAPPEAIAKTPLISVVRARLLINNHKTPLASEALALLRSTYEAMPVSFARDEVLGEIYLMLGVISLIYKTIDFITYFADADTLLPEGSKVIDRRLMLAGGASFVTFRDLGPGSVNKTIAAFYKAMPHAVRVMHGCGAGLENLVAAEADYMTGDLKNAEKNAYAALYKAQPEEQYDMECMAHAILLRIATTQGDYRRASVELKLAAKYLGREQTPECNSICDIAVSGFHVQFGRCDMISGWILEAEEQDISLAPITMNRGQGVKARSLLYSDRYGELLGYLDQLDVLYHFKFALYGRIENAVMRAIAYYYSGDHEEAFKALHESYLLSYENNIIMLHVEFGKWTRTLVKAAKAALGCPIPDKWLDMIHTKASSYAKRLSVMQNAYDLSLGGGKRDVNLSKREKDVLNGLCQSLTWKEIADDIGISLNTVKAMLPLIFEKLGAANSIDAVRIATSLELITFLPE